MPSINSKNLKEHIDKDGFAVIENLFTSEECDEMIEEMRKIVEEDADKKKRCLFVANSNDAPQHKEEYFMDSAHKISFFYEEPAVDPNGGLKVEKEFLAVNKVGHAIHVFNNLFKKYTFDGRIKEICKILNLIDPVITQSMFIFKNPEIGGEVLPHQDLSYIYCEPMTLYGIWIALEDATTENGCLWFEKGSHKGPLHRKFVRNHNKDATEKVIYEGENPVFNIKNYTPAPVKKGSAVILHGKVMHYSAPNTSTKSRNIYTFHLFDQHVSHYSEENWSLPDPDKPYLHVYDN